MSKTLVAKFFRHYMSHFIFSLIGIENMVWLIGKILAALHHH